MAPLDLGSGLIQHRAAKNGEATAFGRFYSHPEYRESGRCLRTLESTQSNIEGKKKTRLVKRLLDAVVFPEDRQEHSDRERVHEGHLTRKRVQQLPPQRADTDTNKGPEESLQKQLRGGDEGR